MGMSQTTLQNAPPSYLYGEYADDTNLQATRQAYNQEANGLFQWLQTVPIADYRNNPISSTLLDFVAEGLYNMQRKVLVAATRSNIKGAFADVAMGDAAFADGEYSEATATVITLNDDQFRRAITWNIYSGDGWIFSTPWLRRRIARFMFGTNGNDVSQVGDQQYISIQWTALRTATIYITAPSADTVIAGVLQTGLTSGYLQSPIGYLFNIILLNFQTSDTDFGGDIL